MIETIEKIEETQDEPEQCSTCGTELSKQEVCTCLYCDMKEIDGPVRVVSTKLDLVMVWQRLANSGIVEFANSNMDVVRKSSWSKKHVKTTIIEGRIVEIFGEQG